ncbi:MAG: hypothetical protein ACTSY1_02150 [Alphaproteobacteria bacterium]
MAAKSRSKRDKAIDALIALAAKGPWETVTLRQIAAGAGLNLSDLRALFADRNAMVLAYFDRVDTAMLVAARSLDSQDTPRDRIFDCLMHRFEAMEADKPALRSILKGTGPVLGASLALRLARTQRWVLEAAGVEVGSGAQACLKTQGLAGIYAKVFRIWLSEDASGLPRTMAALDHQLRAGERWLGRLRGPIAALCAMANMACAVRRNRHKPEAKAEPGATPAQA